MTEVTAPDGVRGLVAQLDSAGRLPAEFRSAFLAAAREWFIPERFWFRPGDEDEDVAVDRSCDPHRWLSAVYADRPLVTQFDDGAIAWPEIGKRPTSSASMPSVVAGMLRALEPRQGDAVLEIGTGTGWNAALLAEIVGVAGQVTTVEIDQGVAGRARANLRSAGYVRVETIEGDAASGLPGDRRFDRVIATAGVHVGQLPYSWVERTVPGGVIVAPMRADMATGPLVRFVVGEDGIAIGRAADWLKVSFMDMRGHRVPSADFGALRWDDDAADRSWTELSPWVPLLADDHRWPIAVALPGCRYDVWERTEDRPGVAWLSDPLSGSWASVVPDGTGRYVVRQCGPRRLWDAAEAAYRWWLERGAPPLSAWEWTVTPDRQSVTLPPCPDH
ncbi:methyltransferase domain-containing protein [Saccharomonospora xinjiangensis]|uniref:methyltransferase domain-containing protein n=1 Tax=Saccharomonospora xinjiangensis TaxID=75294 RepID=UPI0010C54A48|nr:methyltransferase domain-containing protein [Saccharomonospora xinjiangensis]QBQ62043.1 Protein-L-isoaspartate O-methyltransferase [Saccharomonospora xinjiangensis]